MTQPGTPGTSPYGQPYAAYAPPAGPQPPKRSWAARHKILTAVLALVGVFTVLGGIGAALDGGTGPSSADPAASAAAATMPPIPSEQAAANSAASNAPSAPSAPTANDPTTAPATTQPAPPAQPELTTSQEQAVGAARDYLDLQAFSRLGLIEQLSSSYGSGFSKADATFAVDYLHANWREQAVKAAREYLQLQHFSRAGLIQQLSSAYGSKFTRAEATYAVDQVGL